MDMFFFLRKKKKILLLSGGRTHRTEREVEARRWSRTRMGKDGRGRYGKRKHPDSGAADDEYGPNVSDHGTAGDVQKLKGAPHACEGEHQARSPGSKDRSAPARVRSAMGDGRIGGQATTTYRETCRACKVSSCPHDRSE